MNAIKDKGYLISVKKSFRFNKYICILGKKGRPFPISTLGHMLHAECKQPSDNAHHSEDTDVALNNLDLVAVVALFGLSCPTYRTVCVLNT
jgi:hypothetical protein